MTDVGDHSVNTRDIMLRLRNDGTCVRDAMANFGYSYMCIYRKFGLGKQS